MLLIVVTAAHSRTWHFVFAVLARELEVPTFMRDFEAARAELRQVLGYPAEPDAVGSIGPVGATSAIIDHATRWSFDLGHSHHAIFI